MKVRAKFSLPNKFGVYGGKRWYNGEEFDVADPKDISDVWMVKLEEPKPKRGPKPKEETGEGAS